MSLERNMVTKQILVAGLLLVGSLASSAQKKAVLPSTSNSAVENKADIPAAEQKLPDVKPSEYKVGEADVLRINVWKEAEVSQTVVVRTDGNISMPLINEVKVSGLTPLQIQDLVAERLKSFLTNPQVTVTVTEIHSKRAFITGEVPRPGAYPLNTETTVLQLIAQAGGLTPFAKRGDIVVLRFDNGKQQRLRFKYKDVVGGKNTQQNITLQPGDTVVVP
jgi:polysaccharide export outer membrane protein